MMVVVVYYLFFVTVGLKHRSARNAEVRHLLTVLTKQLQCLDEIKVKQLQAHHHLLLNLQEQAKNQPTSSLTAPELFEKERQKRWSAYLQRQGMIDLLSYPPTTTSDAIFTVDESRTCVEGIQCLERYSYREVEKFISALQIQISKLGYGNEHLDG